MNLRLLIWVKIWKQCTMIVLLSFPFFMPLDSTAKEENSSFQSPKRQLNEFLLKKDTNHIFRTLRLMNDHFDQFNSKENLDLLLQVSKKENKLSLSSLKQLFLLIRRYYTSEDDSPKNFEFTLKTYNVLNKTDDHEGAMWILIDLGNVFFEEQDYQQAYKFFKRAEKAAIKANSRQGLAVIYMNIGLTKERVFAFEEALNFYTKSLYYRVIAGQKETLSFIYMKLAYCNLKLERNELCMEFIHKAEKNYYIDCKMPPESIDAPFSIYYIYAKYFATKKQFDSSLVYVQKAIDYAAENQMVFQELMGNSLKAEFFFKKKKYNEAIKNLNDLLPYIRRNRILKFELRAYDLIHQCYSALKDDRNATFYAQKYLVTADSLKRFHTNDKLEMIRSIVSVYEADFKLKKTKKNLQLEKLKTVKRENERNKYWYIAIISVFCVFLLFGLLLNTQKNKLKMVDLHNRLIEQNNKIKINSIELKKSNQLKDNLFFIISNDLSEPLNRFKSDLKNLKSTLNDKKIVDNIENTLDETIHLFEDLLVWSKVDQNQNIFNPTKVGLDVNINKVISFYLNDIRSMQITVINRSVSLFTFADQNILQTLLRNVISNSITALNKSVNPKIIEIETFVHNQYLIELLISDSGPGFPVGVLHQFNQVDYEINSKRKGFGLSICKALSNMSGWKIDIANESKHGGASTSVFIPIFNQIESQETSKILIVSPTIRSAFQPLNRFKVYQTSEIKSCLKNLEHHDDPLIKDWIKAFENTIKEGDHKHYSQLLTKLNKR